MTDTARSAGTFARPGCGGLLSRGTKSFEIFMLVHDPLFVTSLRVPGLNRLTTMLHVSGSVSTYTRWGCSLRGGPMLGVYLEKLC